MAGKNFVETENVEDNVPLHGRSAKEISKRIEDREKLKGKSGKERREQDLYLHNDKKDAQKNSDYTNRSLLVLLSNKQVSKLKNSVHSEVSTVL